MSVFELQVFAKLPRRAISLDMPSHMSWVGGERYRVGALDVSVPNIVAELCMLHASPHWAQSGVSTPFFCGIFVDVMGSV